MPMIDVEWDPKEYSQGDMTALCNTLNQMLRRAIRTARPSVDHEYKVIVRGQPQPPIAIDAPALEIRVDYHVEWKFTKDELDVIAAEMQRGVEFELEELELGLDDGKIRFYARVGYKGVDLRTP